MVDHNRPNSNREPLYEAILIFLQLAPYILYFFVLENYQPKVIATDSFRYLWEDGSLFAYFTNSSLSVRLLYTLLGNNLDLICSMQLMVVAGSQIAIYRCIRGRSLVRDCILTILLILLFTSYHSRWLFNLAMSDSLTTSLYLLFAVVLCMVDDTRGKKVKVLACILVLFFAFSRNTAPYIVLFGATGVFMVSLVFRRKTLHITVVALALSVVAISSINHFDTSTEINVANNIFRKILPSKEKTAIFQTKYGMPSGPYVETCKNDFHLAYCFDYQQIISGSTFTRTYQVTVDNYGFTDWIREKGMKSWKHYLLIHDIRNTTSKLIAGYQEKIRSLFASPPSKIDRSSLIHFDSFVLLHDFYIRMKLDSIISLGLLMAVALVGYLFTGMKKEFLFSSVLLVSGFAFFFVCFFGDIGTDRHVYPAIISIYYGQASLFYALSVLIMKKGVSLIRDTVSEKGEGGG